MIFGVLAMASLGFAVYVRLQPPTVIHVDKDGNASVVGGPHPVSAATFTCPRMPPPQMTPPVLRLQISKAGR